MYKTVLTRLLTVYALRMYAEMYIHMKPEAETNTELGDMERCFTSTYPPT